MSDNQLIVAAESPQLHKLFEVDLIIGWLHENEVPTGSMQRTFRRP
jgi:hypothetical protein